ncbi:MAG TPA: hypothetical protein VFN35_35040 [Ktedonobacteraceae bacterium]|nr:hypothetical protein [Ktedonobacteraceae bacterium]
MVRIRLILLLLLIVGGVLLFVIPRISESRAVATQYTVLFDDAHAETAGNADWVISTSSPDPLAQNANPQKETDWTGGISAWGVALQKTGRYSLKTSTSPLTYGNTTNALDLSHFNALILPEPNSLFSSDEKAAIVNFVRNGGGLFMIADHNGSDRNNDGKDSLQILNDLMNNNGTGNNLFGIQFDVLNIDQENPDNATPNPDPVLNGPFGVARGSIIRNGTTETLSPSANASAHGIIYRAGFSNTGTTGAFLSGSSYGKGRVLAIGDSSPIDDGTCASGNTCFNGWNDPAGQDSILFPNGTEWLASGTTASQPTPTSSATPTAVSSATPSPTPISTNSLQNGGFEQGGSSWVEHSGKNAELVDTSNPHSGSASAHLCGYNTCQDSLYQAIIIPSTGSPPMLSYYWYMSTTETTHAFDFLSVQIRNSSGKVLATLQALNDGSNANSWQSASFDLSAYRGQSVQLAFVATNGSKNPTDFYLDDVSLLSN